jgi:hypothetical protein
MYTGFAPIIINNGIINKGSSRLRKKELKIAEKLVLDIRAAFNIEEDAAEFFVYRFFSDLGKKSEKGDYFSLPDGNVFEKNSTSRVRSEK